MGWLWVSGSGFMETFPNAALVLHTLDYFSPKNGLSTALLLDKHLKSLVPKCYKSIFLYLRKMQPKFGIYWDIN
jgi:hypothetical protein